MRASLDSGACDDVAAAGRAAMSRADELVAPVAEALRAEGRLACADRCSSCCHMEVAASVPELVALSRHVRATHDDERLAALRARLDAQVAADAAQSPRERASRSLPCALLVDDSCSVYAARPLRCRGWNSADVEPCRVAFLEPWAPPSIPVNREMRHAALAVGDGVSDGVREAGLDDDTLSLPAGLRALLQDDGDDLVAHWLEGRLLPGELKSAPAPHRILAPDGRWRLTED